MTEQEGQDKLRNFMHARGWHTEKTHGNMYQSGWPDLLCMHNKFGRKWVECKVPGEKLRQSQIACFLKWSEFGETIYIMHDDDDYDILFGKPNWMPYARNPITNRLPLGWGKRKKLRDL